MNTEDIINYILRTPENINPNILRGMLDKVATNPNTLVTISGTVANPWGEMTVEEIQALHDDILNHQATALYSFGDELLVSVIALPGSEPDEIPPRFQISGVGIQELDDTIEVLAGAAVVYSKSGALMSSFLCFDNVWTNTYESANLSEANLIIIHHPLSNGQ